MSKDVFIARFAEVVEVDPATISLETKLESIGTWDSLSQVSFLALLDEQYSKSIEADELDKATTVDDLWRIASA